MHMHGLLCLLGRAYQYGELFLFPFLVFTVFISLIVLIRKYFLYLTRSRIQCWTWCLWPAGQLVYLALVSSQVSCILRELKCRGLCESWLLFFPALTKPNRGTRLLSVEMGADSRWRVGWTPGHRRLLPIHLSYSCSVSWQRLVSVFVLCFFVITPSLSSPFV